MIKTEEWEQLAPHIRKYVDNGLPYQMIADHCGVKALTVQSWLEEAGPRGLPLVKAWYFMLAAGAKLPNLPRESEAVGMTLALLGLDVISLETAREIFLVKRDQTLYRIFREGAAMRMAFTYEELDAEYGDQLQEAMRLIRDSVREALSSVETVMTETTDPVMEQPKPIITEPARVKDENRIPEPLLIDVASSLSAVLPVIRLLPDSESGATVRRLLGQDGVKLISNLLMIDTSDSVEKIGRLIQEAAPLVHELYEDESTDGDHARERLRQIVGPEEFSETIVQLTAFRSRRGYDRSKKEGAIN